MSENSWETWIKSLRWTDSYQVGRVGVHGVFGELQISGLTRIPTAWGMGDEYKRQSGAKRGLISHIKTMNFIF